MLTRSLRKSSLRGKDTKNVKIQCIRIISNNIILYIFYIRVSSMGNPTICIFLEAIQFSYLIQTQALHSLLLLVALSLNHFEIHLGLSPNPCLPKKTIGGGCGTQTAPSATQKRPLVLEAPPPPVDPLAASPCTNTHLAPFTHFVFGLARDLCYFFSVFISM